MLITFEGGDGGGKTTQIVELCTKIRALGITCSLFREPGSTTIGDQIREILHSMDNKDKMQPMTELLLFAASRAQLVREKLLPALEHGVVVLDRFTDSTLAYQGGGHGVDEEILRSLNSYATGGLIPDLTFLLDIEPEIGLQRRLAGLAFGEEWTRLDDMAMDFHQKVRSKYQEISGRDGGGRWAIINANNDQETIGNVIWHITEQRLKTNGVIEGQIRKER